jgi:hypothetical protein
MSLKSMIWLPQLRVQGQIILQSRARIPQWKNVQGEFLLHLQSRSRFKWNRLCFSQILDFSQLLLGWVHWRGMREGRVEQRGDWSCGMTRKYKSLITFIVYSCRGSRNPFSSVPVGHFLRACAVDSRSVK